MGVCACNRLCLSKKERENLWCIDLLEMLLPKTLCLPKSTHTHIGDLTRSLSLCLSHAHTYAHARKHTHTHSHPQIQIQTPTHTYPHPHTPTPTHPHPHPHPQETSSYGGRTPLMPERRHCWGHALLRRGKRYTPPKRSLSLSFFPSLSLSLSLSPPRLGSLSVSGMTAVAWALLFGDSRIFGDL